MPTYEALIQRLAQMERELTRALAEHPAQSAVDRVKFVRALARLLKTQIELDDEATIPVLETEVRRPSPRHDAL